MRQAHNKDHLFVVCFVETQVVEMRGKTVGDCRGKSVGRNVERRNKHVGKSVNKQVVKPSM